VTNTFTSDEMALFEARFKRVPAWCAWAKGEGAGGREVIEIRVADGADTLLRLAKTDDNRYAANGFDGWALTVADDLLDLLDIVARMLPHRRPIADGFVAQHTTA
jgi:hypothetical protein